MMTTSSRHSGQNLLALVAHVGLLASGLGTLVMFGNALDTGSSALGQTAAALGLLVSSVFSATRLRALGNIMHECTHGIFLDGPKSNIRMGNLLGLFLLQPFSKYADDHKTHHTHLADPLKDRDLARYGRAPIDHGVSHHFWLQVRRACAWNCLHVGFRDISSRVWSPSDSLRLNLARTIWATALGGILMIMAPGGAFWGLLMCFFVFYPLICVWSDVADHFLLREAPATDFSVRQHQALFLSRNHLFRSRILNLLLLPRNDGFHLVHHLFPKTPVIDYPAQHEALIRRWPAYAQLNHELSMKISGITWSGFNKIKSRSTGSQP